MQEDSMIRRHLLNVLFSLALGAGAAGCLAAADDPVDSRAAEVRQTIDSFGAAGAGAFDATGSPVSDSRYRFIGVWRPGRGETRVTGPLSWSAFLDRGKSLTSQGFVLVGVSTAVDDGQRRYVGTFRTGSVANQITSPRSWSKFLEVGETQTSHGLQLVDVEVFMDTGVPQYVGVWNASAVPSQVSSPRAWKSFLELGAKERDKGFRLVDMASFDDGGGRKYVGVWHGGTGGTVTAPQSRSALNAEGQELIADGLRMVDLETFLDGGKRQYAGVWINGTGGNLVSPKLAWSDFVQDGKAKVADGWRLVDLEAIVVDSTGPGGSGGGSTPHADPSQLPKVPSYVHLKSHSLTAIIDFDNTLDNEPQIDLPTEALPPLPVYDDEVVFPNNFCGLRFIGVDRFFWLDENGDIVTDEPYISLKEGQTLWDTLSHTYYLAGIDVTGPIGKCSDSNLGWFFPFPFTQEGSSPLPHLKLVVELGATGRIEFLPYHDGIHDAGEVGALTEDELFSDDVFEWLIELFEESGLGVDFDAYVEELCKEKPLDCPIGNQSDDKDDD
jgi:hypothetical protein